MATRTITKRKKTFRENAPPLVEALFDDFIAGRDVLLEHPRKIDALHRMRIAGKPLRYVMEVCAPLYGRIFRELLEEVKLLLEELGDVHDCDVLLQKLREHLLQIRMLNRIVDRKAEQLPLKEIRAALSRVRSDRTHNYTRACVRLRRWKRTGLRGRLVRSMSLPARRTATTIR